MVQCLWRKPQGNEIVSCSHRKKAAPQRDRRSLRGRFFAVAGSLSHAVPVKPFAHTVGDYVRCDRYDKGNEMAHTFPPPSAASIRWDSKAIIPSFDKCRKGGQFAVSYSARTFLSNSWPIKIPPSEAKRGPDRGPFTLCRLTASRSNHGGRPPGPTGCR